MKQKIELEQHREFGDIISDTFALFKQNFKSLIKSYLVICGVFIIGHVLLALFIHDSVAQDDFSSPSILPQFINLLFSIVSNTALTITVISYWTIYKEKGNELPEVAEVWGYFKYYFFRALGAHFLTTVTIIIGFFFCVLPGVYFIPVLYLIFPIMIIENASILYSTKRAFKIIKGNWWLGFGVILLIGLITLIGYAIILLPGVFVFGFSEWITGKNISGVYVIVQSLTTHLAQFLGVLPITAITLLYFTVVEQKEANSLMNRINLLGKNGPVSGEAANEQY